MYHNRNHITKSYTKSLLLINFLAAVTSQLIRKSIEIQLLYRYLIKIQPTLRWFISWKATQSILFIVFMEFCLFFIKNNIYFIYIDGSYIKLQFKFTRFLLNFFVYKIRNILNIKIIYTQLAFIYLNTFLHKKEEE